MIEKQELVNVKKLVINVKKKLDDVVEYLNALDETDSVKRDCKFLLVLDRENIINSFRECDEEIQLLIDEENCMNDFNEQYKTYKNNMIFTIKEVANKILNMNSEAYNYYQNISTELNHFVNIIKKDIKHKLFEQFKYGNRSYVLFGKNGAGKTTLLNKLSKELMKTNAIVVPATRNINYIEDQYHRESDCLLEKAITSTDNGKTLFLLSKCMIAREIEELRFDPNSFTITKKAEKIFLELGIDRKLEINSTGILKLYGENSSSYSVEKASDGEKTAIYMIFVTLLSPVNAYVFIDEPENHLNGALMRKLFNILSFYRKDVKFVFATHNIPFIESQKNIELIYLEKSNVFNDWHFKKYKDYGEMPLDIILNIEGTNDDVIFCEGSDRNSYDCKLYEILYPQFQVLPSSGCENVISQTGSLNKFSRDLRKKGYGIIDNDFLEEEKIEKLKNENITVLSVNEIENLFIIEECLKSIKEKLSICCSVDDLKNKIISCISNKLDVIKRDFATKIYRRIQKSIKIVDIENIEDTIQKINNNNKEKFLEEYLQFEEKLNKAIADGDYNLLMGIVPGKMIINDVAKLCGLVDGVVYMNLMLRIVYEDIEIRQKLLEIIDLKK